MRIEQIWSDSAILVFIVIVVYGGVMTPRTPEVWLVFIGSFLTSIVIKFGVVYLFSLLCFWTSSGFGVAWARAAVTNLLSGGLVPLAFFSGWLRDIAVSERIPAVQFYLGANHRIRQVTIAIHGSWWYTIEGNRSFQGTIWIYGPGEGDPYDYEHLTVTTTLYSFGEGPLVWQGSRAGQPWIFSYGVLFASRDFRQISIMAPTRLIIAGAASTRKGGLRIANRLIPASFGLKVLR